MEMVEEVRERSGSKGWAVADPLFLMLGGWAAGMQAWEVVAVALISSAFFVSLWEEQNCSFCGSRDFCASGVEDLVDFGTDF